jgi:hypothetical protein
MDYESLNFKELAREYEDIHGARISVNALMYRVREKGMSKTEAVQKSKDRRGEVHRELRDLLYCYLHVECAGMEDRLLSFMSVLVQKVECSKRTTVVAIDIRVGCVIGFGKRPPRPYISVLNSNACLT